MLDRSAASPPNRVKTRAIDYLLAAQASDGSWSDFNLPVGASNGWITALCGYHLAQYGGAAAQPAVIRAAGYLCANGPNWGYNATTPADADSTAWAVLLLARLGRTNAIDPAFLGAHQQVDGGVATYLADDGWGRAHGCVTALAALAFDALGDAAAAGNARNWLRQSGADARAGYWWASPFYPAWAVAQACTGHGALPPLPVLDTARSVLDLACALRIAALAHCPAPDLLHRLCSLQMPDGSFPPSYALRVTYHWLDSPANATDAGRVYADENRILGTCFCLAAIADQSALCAAAP